MRIYVRNIFYNLPQALDMEPTCTIRELKSVIQNVFSLSDEEIDQRLLVIDSREIFCDFLTDCWDLFGAASSTSLAECGVKDETILYLGFKGDFIISIRSSIISDSSSSSDDDDDDDVVDKYGHTRKTLRCPDYLAVRKKLRELKEEEEPATDGCSKEINFNASYLTTIREIKANLVHEPPVNEENFPSVLLFNEDRPLIWFGIYKFSENVKWPQHVIYRSPNNKHLPRPHIDSGNTSVMQFFQIFVEFPNMQWRCPVKCHRTTTIRTVRRHFLEQYLEHQKLFGHTCAKHQLFVLFFGGKLEINSTLQECGINNLDYIEVFEDEQLSIHIILDSKHSIVHVVSFDTIGRMKEKIQSLTGIPKEMQQVSYKGWNLEAEERRLVDYGIAMPIKHYRMEFCHMYGKISLAPSDESGYPLPKVGKFPPFVAKLQITVQIPSKPWRFPLNLKRCHTMHSVRERIIRICSRRHELFDQSYIKEGKFVLFFGNVQLENAPITLDAYGIRHMDSIQLFEKASIGITIYALEHHIEKDVDIWSFDTIGTLKHKIEVFTGIPKEEQYLRYRTWFLDEEGRRLLDYGVTPEKKPLILVASDRLDL